MQTCVDRNVLQGDKEQMAKTRVGSEHRHVIQVITQARQQCKQQ